MPIKASIAFILAAFFIPGPAFVQVSQSPALTGALEELNKGKLFEGFRTLKEIVRTEPSSAPAHFYLSSLYTRMGRYLTAFRHLSTAMEANTGQGAYYHQLGVIRLYEGCRPEALTAFQQALRTGMGKDEGLVWRHIGDLQMDMLASNEAIEAYTNALRLDSNDAGAHLALGRLYLDRNDPERAIVELRAALKTEPGLDGVHANLGRAYRAIGDLQSAVTILEQGIERNPSDQESRYLLGQVLLMLGRNDQGRDEMEEYRRLQDRITQTNATFETAVERAQAGDLDRAEVLLKETLRLAPRYGPALRVLGAVSLNRGNSKGAVEMFQQALTSNPLNPEAYFNLGTAYFESGKLPEAVEMTERALVLEDEDPRFYALLGAIYSKMDLKAQARAAAQQAAQLTSRPGYEPPNPYGAEMRRRDGAAIVKEICGQHANQ
jgi:tetratricopeptide (TPR) repeat protein